MDLKAPFASLIVGAPGRGKTTLIRYMLYSLCQMGTFNHGMVICPTADLHGSYNFVPQEYVRTSYDPDEVKEFMDLQKREISSGKKIEAFLVLDDCLSAAHQFQSDLFVELVTTYRWLHISLFISTQYVFRIPPTVRECANYAFLFKMDTKRSLKAVYETFGQNFETEADFKKYLDSRTKDKAFVFYDKLIEKKEDNYMSFRAPTDIPEFRLEY